jgi:hypothetical protein
LSAALLLAASGVRKLLLKAVTNGSIEVPRQPSPAAGCCCGCGREMTKWGTRVSRNGR